MLIRFLGWFLAVPLVGGLGLFVWMPVAHAAEGPLLIGEVAWAGSSKSLADEWVELWNLGNDPLDLTGYRLMGAGNADGIALTGQVIAPQSALLIANYSASDTKSALATDPHLVTSSISLSNDTLHIQLLDQDGTVVDEAGDGAELPAGATTPTKASMVRTQDGAWKTSDTRDRIDDGVADFGTPGICDGCGWTEPTPVTSTSTEIFVTTSSTEPMASSTIEIVQAIETPPPVLIVETVVAEPPQPIVRVIAYPEFRLHRISPAPASGQKEWVEIRLPDGLQLDALDGYALYDATGRAALFPPKDPTLISQVDRVVRIHLTSAKLNNGGDTVELHRPDGSVVERMTYPETPQAGTWMKNADGTAWISDAPPEESEPEITYVPPPPTIELPTIEPPSYAPRGDDETGTLRSPPEADAEGVESAGPRDKKQTGPAALESKAKSITIAKKTKTKKTATESPTNITHDMLTKIDPNTRVSIRGTVATKSGIVNKNQYVLLSPDGHGLLVRGSSKQPTPAFGTTVRVSGTLTLNDDGLSLGVGANDRWEREDLTGQPMTRTVDLNAPSLEDGWSLIEVTGTVREVGAGSILLDLGDAFIDVKIKNATGYRAARFNEGDVLRVRGLLDERGEELLLVVRMSDDINLISHALVAKPLAEPKRSLPDWLPFGAAGMTIAVSEGYRRLKRIRHSHRERQLAASFTGSS